MGLWAVATIHVEVPKIYNVKDKLVEIIEQKYGQLCELIIDSTYSKDNGLVIGIRTNRVGEFFDELMQFIYKKLKQMKIGYFYIQTHSNYYL